MDTLLIDVPPLVLERFCRVMDSGGDVLGWRGLAIRIVPTYTEVRMLERLEAAGRSPTRELLWSWAQQNTTVHDLLKVLRDMGHQRALQLFQGPAPESSAPESQHILKDDFISPSAAPAAGQHLTGVTLRDIIEGTRNFHPGLMIAEGHFANVYRAQIGNKTFAVKLFKKVDSVSWKTQWDVFRKEMEIHCMQQHPNIIDLVGCFSDDEHYCLVYPYLPNGSLHHKLHQQDGERRLCWEERLTIIKGVAKALHHIHTAQSCPVICGNLSSANIFLDNALQPKLSDFGLARLRPHSVSRTCTFTLNVASHSNPWYLPEEYFRDPKLSPSLDVYSLGMVIMETMTGRKVIQNGPKQTLLRNLLVTAVEDSGGRVDACLPFLDSTPGQWPTDIALRLLDLALNCTASRAHKRPDMESVLLSLSRLLPPPRYPPADQPHSPDDGASVNAELAPSFLSVPVEDDEQSALPTSSSEQASPCECSQSEVTYLSDSVGVSGDEEPDLYSSCPVQCSCSAEDGAQPCEDCRANSLISNSTESPNSDRVVENEPKRRMRNKLSLYNKGLIHTQELFSEAGGAE